MRKLNTEGQMIVERLRFLAERARDCRVFGKAIDGFEVELLNKKAAAEAVKYCKKNGINYWDFLKEVGI